MGELYIHNLRPLIETYNLNTFIETGTGKGTGLDYARRYQFTSLYSIEIITELYNECKEKYKYDKRISLLNTDSISGLQSILAKMTSENRILFWLDAHFPGADFNYNDYFHLSDQPEIHMPLEKEIEIIYGARKGHRDVFIIDDLRIYEDGNYELGNWELKGQLGRTDINFVLSRYKDTHFIQRDYRHQGFLILTPLFD